MKIAVLLTVFNRKDVTIKGLTTLYAAMANVSDFFFDIFMTDDGCSDGTAEAVLSLFPNIHIIKGDGNLFWSGGMRMAWKAALAHADYDFFIWFNDDAMLYEDALAILLDANSKTGCNSIVSGAFHDDKNEVSYGGKTKNWNLISPSKGEYKQIYWMNGNLVLIPKIVYESIGMIDNIFIHGKGDYDYGRRAIKAGFNVLLSDDYVGVTERHDNPYSGAYNKNKSLLVRLKSLYSPFSNPIISFVFCKRHIGLLTAIRVFLQAHIRCLFPSIISIRKYYN